MFGLHTESIILQSLLAAFAELTCCERHATPESGMARRRRPQHVGLCAETPRFLNLLWAVQARRRRPQPLATAVVTIKSYRTRGGAAGGDDGDAAVDEAHISNKQKKTVAVVL